MPKRRPAHQVDRARRGVHRGHVDVVVSPRAVPEAVHPDVLGLAPALGPGSGIGELRVGVGAHGLGQRLVGVGPAPEDHGLRVEEELEGRDGVASIAARLQDSEVGDAVGGQVDRVDVSLGRGVEPRPDRRRAGHQGEPGWVEALGAGDEGLGARRAGVGDRAGRRPRVLGVEKEGGRLVVEAGLEPDVDPAARQSGRGLQGADGIARAGRRRQRSHAGAGIGVVARRRDIEVERGEPRAGRRDQGQGEAEDPDEAGPELRRPRPAARLNLPARIFSEHN